MLWVRHGEQTEELKALKSSMRVETGKQGTLAARSLQDPDRHHTNEGRNEPLETSHVHDRYRAKEENDIHFRCRFGQNPAWLERG